MSEFRGVAQLPGFIGHSVADRKVIEGRKGFSQRLGTDDAKLFQVDLSAAELQAEADRWCREQYAHSPHSALKRKTPFEVAAGWSEPVRAISDETSLDVLLAPVASNGGLRIVGKEGVKVDNERYAVLCAAMPGTQVLCRHDPSDLGRLWLFDPDGETYIGEAINPDLAGADPAEVAARSKAIQKAAHEDTLAQIRKEKRKITPRTVMEAQREAYSHNATVLSFPQKRQEHDTAKTLAASEAKKKRAPRPLSDREAAVLDTLKNEPVPDPVDPMNTPEARFKRARQFEQRIGEGIKLSDADALWLTSYQAGPEYRAHKLIFEDEQAQKSTVPSA